MRLLELLRYNFKLGWMKKIDLLLILFLTFSFTISAQEWETNIEIAKEKSQVQNKNIILVFSGSDWCAPCMKLENNIFSSEEFANYAADNWILLKADFPKRKKNRLSEEQQKHNDALASKYRGIFPLIVVLDSSGKDLGRIGYKKYSPKEYIDFLSSIK